MNRRSHDILSRKVKTGEGKNVLIRFPQDLYDRLKLLQAQRITEAVESGDDSNIGLHHVVIMELNKVIV